MKKFAIIMLMSLFTLIFIACDKTTFLTKNTESSTTLTTTQGTTSSTSEETTSGGNNMEYTGTFDRKYASYYVPGEALIEDAHVVYINWDGFARYYYDELLLQATEQYAPNLYKIMSEGVFFENLRNAMPSITNPVQNQILSGATSAITHNVYRYYNRTTDTVIQQLRENDADTIVNVAIDNGLSVVSFNHYLAEQYLTSTNPAKLYVTADPNNPDVIARGTERGFDHFSRFEQFEKMLKGEAMKVGNNTVTVTDFPKLTLIYCDDLDAIGHNFQDNYGYTKQLSEEGRMQNAITLLKDMDKKLGEVIETAKNAGVYDNLTFFLTTDHGMTPYGASSIYDTGDYASSKFFELKSFIENFDSSFKVEFVAAGSKPARGTNVVAVGANLNIQLTFKDGVTDDQLNALKEQLLTRYYVGKVMTREELLESGYWMEGADMVISPSERYCFSSSVLAQYIAKGQHDSLADSANHIVGWIWGKGIKQNYVYEEVAYNYDFGVTMAAALGIELPEANGIVLDVFDRQNEE